MKRRQPRSTLSSSSAASDVYKRQHSQRWDGAVVNQQSFSLTKILKQAGGQRLASLEQNQSELAQISREMEAQPTNLAMRQAMAGRVVHELQAAMPARVWCHVDWGAATGSFARLLAETAVADRVSSRSFDILPAGDGVEFGDQSVLREDIGPGTVDLVTGIANLVSTQDLPGFFATCATQLRPGGILLLLQPIGFASPTMAIHGAGRLTGLFECCGIEWLDLRVQDKGCLLYTSEPTRLLSISYAVFCLKKKNIPSGLHLSYVHRRENHCLDKRTLT
eukprot:TRINITY_DN44807_c0_g1_i1.p1 TRINITY_DN44807_c0_g1~~TRINITY_DN44807_c0_g1_i1.p1  ORF type:complete len:278 (-),score=69.23 TRINITY_DN44807_c0_g1_i1:13-846(-)